MLIKADHYGFFMSCTWVTEQTADSRNTSENVKKKKNPTQNEIKIITFLCKRQMECKCARYFLRPEKAFESMPVRAVSLTFWTIWWSPSDDHSSFMTQTAHTYQISFQIFFLFIFHLVCVWIEKLNCIWSRRQERGIAHFVCMHCTALGLKFSHSRSHSIFIFKMNRIEYVVNSTEKELFLHSTVCVCVCVWESHRREKTTKIDCVVVCSQACCNLETFTHRIRLVLLLERCC